MQLTMFESNEIDQRVEKFKELIALQQLPFDLVAVNKKYKWSAVVCDSEEDRLYYVHDVFGQIRKAYVCYDDVGTNYHIINPKYEHRGSVALIKGRQYTSCPVSSLERYLADGWQIE